MRKLLILFLGLFMFAGLFAIITPPSSVDPEWEMAIPNNYEFSEEEIDAALEMYRGVYESWLGESDPGFFSMGQTGLMILDLFALGDTLTNAAQFQQMLIADQVYEMYSFLWYLEESFFSIVDSVEDQYDLIDNLYDFMVEGKPDSIMMLRDSLIAHFYDRLDMTGYNIDKTLWNLGMFGDSLGTRFDTVLHANEDFMFKIGEVSISAVDPFTGFPIAFDTTEIATIYDETFESIWVGVNHFVQGLDYLGTGINLILDGDSTMQVGLDTLALSMVQFQNVMDTLNNYSMWPIFGLVDVDSSDLSDVQNGFAEVEAVVNGKTYFIYRWDDGTLIDSIEIRPIGIVENIHYGLYSTYIDMYWQADPYAYDFRGILPQGLPADIVDVLAADMVIDPRDSLEQFEDYLTFKYAEFSAKLIANPTDIDAHVGMGYIESFALGKDAVEQFKTIAALVDGGRIDSLFQNYDWSNLDYTDEVASIRQHLDKQYEGMMSGNYQLFTILVKDPWLSSPGHTISEGDLVYPVYIIPQVTDGIVQFSYVVENALYAVADGLEHVYMQIDSVIDITLDPNLLDLSDIEEPLDLIYALEASNPNFGAFTPEGKVKFAAFGDSLAIGMLGLADFADTIIATVDYAGPLLGEFGMSPEDHDTLLMNLQNINYHIDMFAADLAVPEVYSYVDGDTLNLSAWFDNVPDNMLAVWKDFFEGRDSSLAGFFPMRVVTPGIDPTYVPSEFALKGNYPNPFNPMTTIAFDLPMNGMVKMEVFNIAGRKVATLIDKNMQAGSYEMTWNAANHSSGVYIVRVQHGTDIAYQKMTLLK